MKLRDPKDKIDPLFNLDQTLQNLDQQAAQREEEKWHKYTIEVITPIFGGGVKAGEPDTKMPIRASAIRGQLRYWWRFLAKNRRVKPLSGEDLFKAERDIWGGMAEENEGHPSKVRIRVKLLSKVPRPKPYSNDPPKYTLFPARQQTDPPQPPKDLIWIDSNNKLTFDLQICVPLCSV